MHCKYLKQDSEQCGANALVAGDYCFVHSPDMETERQLAASKGGKHSYKQALVITEEKSIKTPKDIADLLESTINEVRAGKLDVRIANCVGYLASHLIKSIEASDFEKRLENLEVNVHFINPPK